MAYVCALTGETPVEPVISPKSGAVFERAAIEKHLAGNDTDPTNDQPLTADELIPVKNAPEFVRPRPPNATSIPALLKLFQDEWDATMLEAFELKRANHEMRQELTHALYQHDAACRVIARLTKERDQARQALAALSAAAPAAAAATAADGATAMEGVESANAIPEEVAQAITAKAKELAKGRKKRAKSPGLATVDDVKGFSESASHKGMHTASNKSITSLSVRDNLVLTGGSDKNAVLFDLEQGSVTSTLKGHTKKITDVELHPSSDVAVTCSTDNSVRVWNASAGTCQHELKIHKSGVTGLSIHPTGSYVLSSGGNNEYALSDIETGTLISTVADQDAAGGLTGAQFHPDGVIFGLGTGSGAVRIWDVKEQTNVATFEGHSGALRAMAFSENGYYMATAAEDATVKLWDLRKLRAFHTIEFDAGQDINALAFDYSGSYLAIGGSDIRTYVVKQWDELCTLSDHKKTVTGVHWGADAKSLISCGNDNMLRVFA